MTLQEIKEKIAAYESKWGKLGHTNIMKPENELQHSTLNERRNTMIKTTNDFYKFRQKVAIGKEANKLAHKATISPEELNERNFQNQIENNTLIHAGKNFKYVAKEDINGRPRYFYTQEEYDAYKHGNQNATKEDYKQRSQASEDFNRENDERWAYEVSKNRKSGNDNWEREMLANEKGKQMDKDLKYVDSLKKDVSEGVRDVIHDHKNPVGKLMDYIEDAFEDDELRMDEKGNMTGDEKVIAKIQEMSKEAEKYGKNLGSNLGEEGGKKVWDEFQKQTGDRVSKLTRAYNVKDEALKAYDENGEDGVADYLLGTDEWKKMEKEVRKAIGDGKLRLNRDKSGFNRLSKDEEELLDNLYEEIDGLIDVVTDGTGINRRAIGDLLGNELINLAASHSETKYETNSNGKDNYNSGDKKFANTNKETDEYGNAELRKMIENEDRKRENSRKNNGSRNVYGKDNNPERDRYAKIKHSAFDEEDETPSYKTAADLRQEREESIMSEYRAFKARANKGAEKNRLSHSAVISPRDLNAKYEEELMKEYIAIHPENDDDIEHSSNGYGGTYLHKLDDFYGPGKPRYFYSEADWNAYQEGLKRNNYNADKEAEARQAKTDKQKADLAKRSGMENYTKYQENKKADEEADARQAKIDEQKTRAKQEAGMEGYEEWNEKRQAEKEANAKKVAEDRNDMSGYAAWKKRRDYINNQKKASEAAETAEAEKHEIERKAVKNSVEVTKNKAAAKAQEAAEAEKHKAESAKRIGEENAASKEAAIKAGQESTAKLIAENEARDKEHEKDVETRKLNEKYEKLDNNIKNILKNTSDKYDKQIEGLNKQLKSIDGTSPEAKEIQRKISDTNMAKDAALDKELSTIIEDLGELYQKLDDKNGAEAEKLKAAAEKLVKDNLNLGPVTSNVINNLQKTVLPEFFTHLKTGSRKF